LTVTSKNDCLFPTRQSQFRNESQR